MHWYGDAREELPDGITLCETQVAGHTAAQGCLGLLKSATDGTVLKPTGKVLCGIREIGFYERLEAAQRLENGSDNDNGCYDWMLLELSKLVPRYYGHPKLPIDGKEVEFIQLEDLTEGYERPCIMDVKIGRRTWDPLATPEKRKAEESKYRACRQHLGLCIPGLQAYSVHDHGRLIRHGRDYGKKLTEVNIRDAFLVFLNADRNGHVCRELVESLLQAVRPIQDWAHRQTTFRLYSSSVLLVYDAARLKQKIHKSLTRDNISPAAMQRPLAVAKMIDFAHAFTTEESEPAAGSESTVDANYIHGVDSLVAILEQFLDSGPL
ncbi:inositol polyphosphate multikinase-like [Anopheles cruzii]|uniref:inositol polyphosphate multikinase-like n=1 Tax=Anopheles cruzii TaxID=68878 RepID=UPI0022EC7543|nr:inositol polyphosphate multikinase-like [Anopheles cruzii]